MQVKYRK